jgi:hypothetical protein
MVKAIPFEADRSLEGLGQNQAPIFADFDCNCKLFDNGESWRSGKRNRDLPWQAAATLEGFLPIVVKIALVTTASRESSEQFVDSANLHPLSSPRFCKNPTLAVASWNIFSQTGL